MLLPYIYNNQKKSLRLQNNKKIKIKISFIIQILNNYKDVCNNNLEWLMKSREKIKRRKSAGSLCEECNHIMSITTVSWKYLPGKVLRSVDQ